MHFAYLTALMLAAAPQTSIYTRLTNSNICAVEVSALAEEGGDEKYDCPGPVANVGTLLHRGADWDHLYLRIDGQQYSLWEPMVAVGSWSGFGNKNGLAEWRFVGGKPKTRATLTTFIVRFEGTMLDKDGNGAGTRSRLAVFGLTPGSLCWKGNYVDNVSARKAAVSAPCMTMLTPEEVAG
jgi:hypothetical protein